MTDRAGTFWTMGALFALLGVAARAFGAHWLEAVIPPDLLTVFETGARYQMYAAFGVFMAAIAAERAPGRAARAAGWLFIVGIVLFSGSLYTLALPGIRWLGAI